MPAPDIRILDLNYQYSDGTLALDGISLEAGQGETLAVVGASGAGKSTLLMHLNGTLVPQQGEISIRGTKIEKKSLNQIRETVGMVFQNPDDQLFMPTVREDVAFGPGNMGLDQVEIEKRVEESLHLVGAWRLRDKAPYHLSEGEKRSVAIAGILAMKPDIMVMDEPGTGLDPMSRRNLIRLLGKMTCTTVIATHDLDMALDVCSKCLVLHQGRIAAFGNTPDILADSELLAGCMLEPPFRLMPPH